MKQQILLLALAGALIPSFVLNEPIHAIQAQKTVEIEIPLQHGEFFDKLTILMIKRERIHDAAKRKNIDKEFALLDAVYKTIKKTPELSELMDNLLEANIALWELEDLTREKEARKECDDDEFIELVLKIVENNDTRFAIKRAINTLLSSTLVEEKSYIETLARDLETDMSHVKKSRSLDVVTIPISLGDLLDRISILEIKLERITDSEKLTNIRYEYKILMEIYKENITPTPEIEELYQQLLSFNKQMWDVQDGIRKHAIGNKLKTKGLKIADEETKKELIRCGRGVYFSNDGRVRVKREINMLCGSSIVDEKQYAQY